MDIFEKAAREKLRFDSPIGDLTTEQLWDLPLTSANIQRPSLDFMARAVSRELRDFGEESFDSKTKAGTQIQST